jgi:hypothetical protein
MAPFNVAFSSRSLQVTRSRVARESDGSRVTRERVTCKSLEGTGRLRRPFLVVDAARAYD